MHGVLGKIFSYTLPPVIQATICKVIINGTILTDGDLRELKNLSKVKQKQH